MHKKGYDYSILSKLGNVCRNQSNAAQQMAEEHRKESLMGLESELEELRQDAKRKEKNAIQKIIDAVVS